MMKDKQYLIKVYDMIYNNWWGDRNPSSNNDQLIEWKFLPWESNIVHSDDNPLKMELLLDKYSSKPNELQKAILCFLKSNRAILMGYLFDLNQASFIKFLILLNFEIKHLINIMSILI